MPYTCITRLYASECICLSGAFFPRIEISLGVITAHIMVTAIHLFRNIYYKTLKLSRLKKKKKRARKEERKLSIECKK